ncbi:conserved hypothetical protein, partial [Ricinus communis]
VLRVVPGLLLRLAHDDLQPGAEFQRAAQLRRLGADAAELVTETLGRVGEAQVEVEQLDRMRHAGRRSAGAPDREVALTGLRRTAARAAGGDIRARRDLDVLAVVTGAAAGVLLAEGVPVFPAVVVAFVVRVMHALRRQHAVVAIDRVVDQAAAGKTLDGLRDLRQLEGLDQARVDGGHELHPLGRGKYRRRQHIHLVATGGQQCAVVAQLVDGLRQLDQMIVTGGPAAMRLPRHGAVGCGQIPENLDAHVDVLVESGLQRIGELSQHAERARRLQEFGGGTGQAVGEVQLVGHVQEAQRGVPLRRAVVQRHIDVVLVRHGDGLAQIGRPLAGPPRHHLDAEAVVEAVVDEAGQRIGRNAGGVVAAGGAAVQPVAVAPHGGVVGIEAEGREAGRDDGGVPGIDPGQ